MTNDTLNVQPERLKEHRENRKKNRPRRLAENQASASVKFVRIPPRKARLVIDAVRGKYAMDARAFLNFVPNRAAHTIDKVLASAIANASNNHGLNPANLKLVEARVDEGPRMKRVQPRAQGRAYRILKRMCHITVVVEEVAPKPRKVRTSARRPQAVRTAPSAAETATAVETAPAVENTTAVEENTTAEQATAAAETTHAAEITAEAVESAAETETPAETAAAADAPEADAEEAKE